MIGHFFLIFFFFCASINGDEVIEKIRHPHYHLSINLFCADRSGLARDHSILTTALENLGCKVNHYSEAKPTDVQHADINIYCESLIPECFSFSSRNWLIPNPEWMWDNLKSIDSVDLILCRTHEVERIFQSIGKETYFLGFYSFDHYDSSKEKDYNLFIHVAGTSAHKGTYPLIEAWRLNPHFPHLTVIRFTEPEKKVPENVTWIKDWMLDEELCALQNQCGVHLCLSQTEGFGHFLVEAMGTKAVVITTDAPPMNEFIKDKRCLVPYTAWSIQGLATKYYVSRKDIEKKIKEILLLPQTELKKIGNANRECYRKLRREFHSNLENLIKSHL